MYGRDHQNIVKQLSSNSKKVEILKKKKKKPFTCAARRGLLSPRKILNIHIPLPFVVTQAILPHQKDPGLTFSQGLEHSPVPTALTARHHGQYLQHALQSSLHLSHFAHFPDHVFAPSTVVTLSSASLLSS